MLRARPDQSRWGGKRPGAGAPKGNLNALKTGRSSPRVRALLDLLLTIPEMRQLLLALWSQTNETPTRRRKRGVDAFRQLLNRIADENNQRFRTAFYRVERQKEENKRPSIDEILDNQRTP